ncbi:MAG: BTB/POZ domain-containing protein [Lachnospiraceae bacterium]|nr:BTB/POZ domain-containing protein [Lachnospiraceae bacterium]
MQQTLQIVCQKVLLKTHKKILSYTSRLFQKVMKQQVQIRKMRINKQKKL